MGRSFASHWWHCHGVTSPLSLQTIAISVGHFSVRLASEADAFDPELRLTPSCV